MIRSWDSIKPPERPAAYPGREFDARSIELPLGWLDWRKTLTDMLGWDVAMRREDRRITLRGKMSFRSQTRQRTGRFQAEMWLSLGATSRRRAFSPWPCDRIISPYPSQGLTTEDTKKIREKSEIGTG
jgi:hypothetical protein